VNYESDIVVVQACRALVRWEVHALLPANCAKVSSLGKDVLDVGELKMLELWFMTLFAADQIDGACLTFTMMLQAA